MQRLGYLKAEERQYLQEYIAVVSVLLCSWDTGFRSIKTVLFQEYAKSDAPVETCGNHP